MEVSATEKSSTEEGARKGQAEERQCDLGRPGKECCRERTRKEVRERSTRTSGAEPGGRRNRNVPHACGWGPWS